MFLLKGLLEHVPSSRCFDFDSGLFDALNTFEAMQRFFLLKDFIRALAKGLLSSPKSSL